MGNGILLALALSGGGVSPATLQALTAMRQRNYEKLCMFIKWLATTLVYGYYWLKKHPEVKDQSGAPDITGKGTQAFIDAFWTQTNQKDFIANLIREGADLVMAWLKPDDFESSLWGSLLQHPSPAAQTNQLLQGVLQQPAAPASQLTLQQFLQMLQQQAAPAQPAPVGPLGSATNPIIRPRGGNL